MTLILLLNTRLNFSIQTLNFNFSYSAHGPLVERLIHMAHFTGNTSGCPGDVCVVFFIGPPWKKKAVTPKPLVELLNDMYKTNLLYQSNENKELDLNSSSQYADGYLTVIELLVRKVWAQDQHKLSAEEKICMYLGILTGKTKQPWQFQLVCHLQERKCRQ